MKKKIAAYTAIFGNYDDLPSVPSGLTGCDLYCFTDNSKLESEVFNIVYIKPEYGESVRNARKAKVLSHKYLPEYEYTIWFDSSFDIIKLTPNPLDWAKNVLGENDLATFRHPFRFDVYEELEACVDGKKDKIDIMR